MIERQELVETGGGHMGGGAPFSHTTAHCSLASSSILLLSLVGSVFFFIFFLLLLLFCLRVRVKNYSPTRLFTRLKLNQWGIVGRLGRGI
jgi:hypothetical protein